MSTRAYICGDISLVLMDFSTIFHATVMGIRKYLPDCYRKLSLAIMCESCQSNFMQEMLCFLIQGLIERYFIFVINFQYVFIETEILLNCLCSFFRLENEKYDGFRECGAPVTIVSPCGRMVILSEVRGSFGDDVWQVI